MRAIGGYHGIDHAIFGRALASLFSDIAPDEARDQRLECRSSQLRIWRTLPVARAIEVSAAP
jgi:hypothetical protein